MVYQTFQFTLNNIPADHAAFFATTSQIHPSDLLTAALVKSMNHSPVSFRLISELKHSIDHLIAEHIVDTEH